MAPVVDGLRKEYEGEIAFRLYDVDKSEEGQEIAARYELQYVPTFVFVDAQGETVKTLVGTVTESDFRAQLDALKE